MRLPNIQTMVTDAPALVDLAENTLPAHRALEFCGVEDESACLKQRRSTSEPTLPPSGTSSWNFPVLASPRAPPTKAVLEWEAGRERRASFACNPRRSKVISAYFQQELSSLSKQAAAQK
ncbi:hypothetical protein T484DRAFT_1746714 [Baffinella frigidus]|nr:hypothetical protein T484DRAFT_1746714 [Cryptophyta sp. CCMP2293]